MGDVNRDISLRNSIILGMTLEKIFSSQDIFDSFIYDINRSTESKSIHKYIWNTELEEQARILDKTGIESILNNGISESNNVELLDIQKQSNKIIYFKIRAHNKLEFKNIECLRRNKSIYQKLDGSEQEVIIVEPNDEVLIPRFTMLKYMCTPQFYGVLKNARMKMPNMYFANGVQTPYDILNRCTLMLQDNAYTKA